MQLPTPWAAVLLDAPLAPETGAEALVARLRALGVSATPTREGWLALPGDLLARAVAAPYPPDLFAHPGALEAPTRAHVAHLEITGGGLDEHAGIAGVVLWPAGRLPLGSRDVALLEAFPITPAELARFRAGEQEAWMDAVEAESAYGALEARWCGAT